MQRKIQLILVAGFCVLYLATASMADGLRVGNTGAIMAADEVNSVFIPRTKIAVGADNSAGVDVSTANPLPVLDPILELSRGNVTGVSSGGKFGRNIDIDTGANEDIWDAGGVWVAPTTARIHNIASSSTDDDGAPVGDGARTIRVSGLTDWGIAEVSETVILNGTTDVPTVNSYVIVNKLEVLTSGATSINVGVISATAVTDATVTSQILATLGQSHSTVFGWPSTQTLYVTQMDGSFNKLGGASGAVDVVALINTNPDVQLTNFITKHNLSARTDGSSSFYRPFVPYVKLAGPGILKFQGSVTADNSDISAGYGFFLVTD